MKIKKYVLWGLIVTCITVLCLSVYWYIGTSISMKYEVDHSELLFENLPHSILDRKAELVWSLEVSKVFFFSSLVVFSISTFLLIAPSRKNLYKTVSYNKGD